MFLVTVSQSVTYTKSLFSQLTVTKHKNLCSDFIHKITCSNYTCSYTYYSESVNI